MEGRRDIAVDVRERDEYEERAAILEYHGGFSRDEAEKRARAMVRSDVARDTRDYEQGMFL